jgi:hypothetical protein
MQATSLRTARIPKSVYHFVPESANAYKMTLRCVQIFASWKLLRWLYQLIHCYCSKCCTYYRRLLLLLGIVSMFICRNYYLYAYVHNLHVFLIHNLVFSCDLHEEIRQITIDTINQYRLSSFTIDGNHDNSSNQPVIDVRRPSGKMCLIFVRV